MAEPAALSYYCAARSRKSFGLRVDKVNTVIVGANGILQIDDNGFPIRFLTRFARLLQQ